MSRHKTLTASFVKSVISHPTLEIVDHKRAEPDNNALPDFMHVNAQVTQKREELFAAILILKIGKTL